MATTSPLGDADTPLDCYAARDLVAHRGQVGGKGWWRGRNWGGDPVRARRRPPLFFSPLRQVHAVAWSCTGRRLASGASDGTVKVWAPDRAPAGRGPEAPVADLRAPPPAAPAPGARPRGARVSRIAWHPTDPDVLLAAGDDAPLRLWDARGAAPRGALPSGVPAGAVNIALAWNPVHTNIVAVVADSDAVSVVDLGAAHGAGAVVATLPPPGCEVNDVAWGPDGTLLCRARGDGGVDLFAWPGLERVARLAGHTSTVFSLAASPCGHHLASGGADAAVLVWDVRCWAPIAAVGGLDHPIKSVSFGGGGGGEAPAAPSATGTLLAYAGDGDAVAIDAWGAAPGEKAPATFLLATRARVECVAWCPRPGGGLAFTGPLYAGPRGESHGAVGLFAPSAR